MAKKNTKGITVKKEDNFSDWYSELVQKADLADIRFGIQGFIVHKPWGFMIIRKIYEYLEKEVELQGHLPFLFPRAVKEESLRKEEKHAGFTPEVLWVSEAGDGKLEERFALPPTGEAQIYPMYSLWFRSHRDLPFKGYQSRMSVFRNEMTTRPFLRGREFLFFETHDVFNTHKEALEQIKLDFETCEKVIRDKAKIPFYYFRRPEWDKFMGANDTFTPDTLMPDGKRNQLASTHDLGQNFSKAYDIKIRGTNEKDNYAYQTCFGPGIWRIMAALIGIHGDDNGLVLPFDMAPLQIVFIPITFTKKPELSEKAVELCHSLAKKLQSEGYKVKIDDGDISPGEKYNKWDLRGVPLRIEIGPRDVENKQLVIKLRTSEERETISENELLDVVEVKVKELDNSIEKKANSYLKGKVQDANSLSELEKIMKKSRGFVRVPWCSVKKEGEACEEIIKEKTQGARVCGTLYPKEEKVKQNDKCVACGKKANHVVYLAKSY